MTGNLDERTRPLTALTLSVGSISTLKVCCCNVFNVISIFKAVYNFLKTTQQNITNLTLQPHHINENYDVTGNSIELYSLCYRNTKSILKFYFYASKIFCLNIINKILLKIIYLNLLLKFDFLK